MPDGPDELKCKADGTWNKDWPNCIAGYPGCAMPLRFEEGYVIHRDMHRNYVNGGEEVEFRCHDPYVISGSARLKCNGKTRQFNKPFPTCQMGRCPWFAYQRYGEVVENATHAVFSCNPGWKLQGAPVLKCVVPGGNWDVGRPNCVRDTTLCPSITTFSNGKVHNYGNTVGSVVRFTCNKGYKLTTEHDTITCRNGGVWGPVKIPRCARDLSVPKEEIEKTCPQIVDLGGGLGKCEGDNGPRGKVKCSCVEGFSIAGYTTLECKRWYWTNAGSPDSNFKLPTCKDDTCNNPRPFRGTARKYYYGYRYSCHSGYKTGGKRQNRCTKGQWSSRYVPRCSRRTCDSFIRIEGGDISYNIGDDWERSSYDCHDGWQKQTWRLYCKRGTTNRGAYCRRVEHCPRIDGFDNGSLKTKTKYGTQFLYKRKVFFSCNAGYVRQGPKTVTCQYHYSRGGYHYSAALPVCIKKECPPIKSFAHGRVRQYSNMPGVEIFYECDDGYRLTGRRKNTCRGTSWKFPHPECQRFGICPSICLDNGKVVTPNGKKSGESAFFSCNDGYTLIGPSDVQCNSNGQWEEDPPRCVPDLSPDCMETEQNIFFIVDISEKSAVDKAIKAVITIGSRFNLEKTRIGVITYSKKAELTVPLGEISSIADLVTADFSGKIDPNRRTRSRNLQKALSMVRKTAPKNNKNNKAIILNFHMLPRKTKVLNAAAKARAAGITLYALSVNGHEDAELGFIDAVGDAGRVMSVSGWRDVEKAALQRNVVAMMCGDDVEEKENVLPEEPVYECKEKQLDIYIVVDISKSIGDQQLIQERSCVRSLFNYFDLAATKTRVGIITYHKYVMTEFTLAEHTTREQINDVDVVQRPIKVAGTKTDLALEQMLENFDQEQIAGREKICILITDGKATSSPTHMKNIADKIEQRGDIKLVAVGVGSGVDKGELQLLATGWEDQNVIIVSNFNDMNKINDHIARTACA